MGPSAKKTLITALIILLGSGLAVAFSGGSPVTAYQSQGIAVDFGDRDVMWFDVNLRYYGNPIDALVFGCQENNVECSVNDGVVMEIRGVANSETASWGLWVIEKGSLDWEPKKTPYDGIGGHSVAAWAYCGENDRPAVGVDQSGRSIHGYTQAQRIVTLTPSITELVGALNAEYTLVGTDSFSNYPKNVVEFRNKGHIATVGGYVDPNFEAIMKTNPDVVFCDGGLYSHHLVAKRVRDASVNAIILYDGEGIETIRDNLFIMGMVMGYEIRALDVLAELEQAESEIMASIVGDGYGWSNVMVALSPNKSPWVSGSLTYFDDVLRAVSANNVFSQRYGWVNATSESILEANPNAIIVIAERYNANEADYKHMMDGLSAEWKNTDAYKSGRVFMFTGDLGEMAQRAGPRYAQLMEIVSLALSPTPGIPKYIGDEYADYLNITEYMGYG